MITSRPGSSIRFGKIHPVTVVRAPDGKLSFTALVSGVNDTNRYRVIMDDDGYVRFSLDPPSKEPLISIFHFLDSNARGSSVTGTPLKEPEDPPFRFKLGFKKDLSTILFRSFGITTTHIEQLELFLKALGANLQDAFEDSSDQQLLPQVAQAFITGAKTGDFALNPDFTQWADQLQNPS